MQRSKPRDYVIDGRPYAVTISAAHIDEERNVHLRVTFRALFGTRSVRTVRGITNRSFWHDYPHIEEMRAKSISLTPKAVCELVRLAHRAGWTPENCRSNFEFHTTTDDIRALAGSSDA
jgi:hypothetical protein